MDRLKQVLVGIDFSTYSESALIQAGRLAAASSASLRVVHVVESDVLVDLERALPHAAPGLRENVLATLSARLKGLVELHVPAGTECRTEVRTGSPAAEILGLAKTLGVDLMVLGAHGTGGAGDGAAGILATKCVRKAPCKVMLVRAAHGAAFRRVAVLTDFSPVAARAAMQGIRVAQMDQATLSFLHMFQPPWAVLHYAAPTPQADPHFIAGFRQALDAEMEAFLAPFAADLKGITVERRILDHMHPASGIVAWLGQEKIDLAVVGTHGRSALIRMIIGTTAERILRDSPCSVLAVKPEGSEIAGT